MRNILIAATALACLVPAYTATASSESAWTLLDRRAHSACTQAIRQLSPVARVSRSTGRVTGIGGDGDQYYALLFKGKEGGADGRWLCVFDKHTLKAQARDITD